MKVEDEYGNPWHVAGGDPGAKAVNALRRRNFDYVVLPYSLLAWGKADATAAGLTEEWVEMMPTQRRVRLKDCLEVLT